MRKVRLHCILITQVKLMSRYFRFFQKKNIFLEIQFCIENRESLIWSISKMIFTQIQQFPKIFKMVIRKKYILFIVFQYNDLIWKYNNFIQIIFIHCYYTFYTWLEYRLINFNVNPNSNIIIKVQTSGFTHHIFQNHIQKSKANSPILYLI